LPQTLHKKRYASHLPSDAKDVGFWVDEIQTLMPLGLVAVSKLSVVFAKAYNAGILQIWCLLMYIHFILLHVEFEDGLSISFF
jgi:hypothetical protein